MARVSLEGQRCLLLLTQGHACSLAHLIPNIPSDPSTHICYQSQDTQGQMSRHSYPFWVGTVFEEECVAEWEEGQDDLYQTDKR